MSQHRGAKGESYHVGRLIYPPEKKSMDTGRIAQRAEWEQARRKSGYWS